jgi:4-hydroxy-4-methyl-2-oxoglutarate aldolase
VEPTTKTKTEATAADRDMDLLARYQQLRTAVVSDCLDQVGIRDNAMAARLRPLYPSARLAGFAMPVQLELVTKVPADQSLWYKGELEAIDSLKPGDVVVVSTCAGPIWGELLATAARARGAVGIVADAGVRDTVQLTEMDFPTFTSLVLPTDGLGRADVTSYGVPVRSGDVLVSPGDIVIADNDGIVVVPITTAAAVLELAEAKSSAEDMVREELSRGDSAREVFGRHGVL